MAVPACWQWAEGVGSVDPANIILCARGGVPKVVDFGLAKGLRGEAGSERNRAETIAGTTLYMSPETITSPDAGEGHSAHAPRRSGVGARHKREEHSDAPAAPFSQPRAVRRG